MIRILFAVILCISCVSCEKGEDISHENYLMFGHFYGECGGEECVEIFRLEEGRIWEDRRDDYPRREYYVGSYTRLSPEKFQLVKDVKTHFPPGLLNEPTVIGQPDAGDWGGLYIEYNYNGIRKFWLLDQMKSNVPAQYHNFIDKVNEKIALLK